MSYNWILNNVLFDSESNRLLEENGDVSQHIGWAGLLVFPEKENWTG